MRFAVEGGTNLFNPSLNIRGASHSVNTVWHLSVRPFDDCNRLSLSLVFVCHSFATAREGLSIIFVCQHGVRPCAGRQTFIVGKPRTPYRRAMSTHPVYYARPTHLF